MSEKRKIRYRKLLFGVRRSIRYHDRRQRFYSAVRHATDLMVFVFASATFATFGAEIASSLPVWIRLLPAILATLMTGIALAYHVGDKSALHGELKRKFIDLEVKLVSPGVSDDEGQIDQVTRERLRVEANEPPVLRVLDTLCHNELAHAMGFGQEEQFKVGFFQRRLAPFVDFGEHRLKKRKAPKAVAAESA